MGTSNGKCRRPNGVLKGKDGCSSLYAICGSKPSSILYNKSLENCSLKLYRVENDGEHDEVVVMLDCGGRVYANGRKVYPFDNAAEGTEEPNISQIIGELTNGRIPDVFGKGNSIEKHLSPGDYAGALDSLLSVVADTFNQLLLDGLKMQEGMRTLEEDKTNLSLKVLELKREQLHSQKLELEKKKLELRVEELETSLSLQSGILPKPTYRASTLARSSTIGIGDGPGRYVGPHLRKRQPPNRTGSLRRDGSLPKEPEDVKNGHHPRHKVVARLKELEVEREQITHQSSLLQFQLDALSAQHELAQSKKGSPINGKITEPRSRISSAKENGLRSSVNESFEKLSTSSNESSINGSPLNAASMNEDPFDCGSSTEDYTMSESSEAGVTKNRLANNGSATHGGNESLLHGTSTNGSSVFENMSTLNGSSEHRQMNGGVKNYNECGSSEEDHTDGPSAKGTSGSRKGSGSDGYPDSFREHRYKAREATWEKYGTLKKRYEDLKKKRAQRLQQGGVFVATDDMSSSPALQQRTPQIDSCRRDVALHHNTPLVDC